MTQELIALTGPHDVGRITAENGRLRFAYTDEWRERDDAFPLSLSMPLAAQEHPHRVIEPFLWGLLPDNEAVLARWASQFHVSPRNPFALLSHVGEDCAGAVQFATPERRDAFLAGENGNTTWLGTVDIAERLQQLRQDHTAWRTAQDTGQFSLAGAQPKTALIKTKRGWGIPSGRTPTTHILKPPTGAFDGYAENEHFCLTLARALGLPAARSEVTHFGDEIAIVIERFDRRQSSDGKILRIHQEDMCQALAISPLKKYENEGGPGVAPIVELIRSHSIARTEDVQTFLDAIALNWLIAGTDGHAKNYALLIGAAGRARLAPLYDVASALPYERLEHQKLKLAMKIGRKYRIRDINGRSWRRLAETIGVDDDALIERLKELASRIPDEAASARSKLADQELDHPVLTQLSEQIRIHAERCRRDLA
ncbi:MAG: type II toxin-antitoxin system HipA family toxin [Pseudomonadota bacterium]